MDKTDRYLVPGLARGLEVLQAFTPARPRLTLAELATLLGTTRSALFRITYTLTALGYLAQAADRQHFTVGPAVLRLGHGLVPGRRLVEAALPLLEALRQATGWSAHLGVLEGRELVYLLRLATRPKSGRAGIVQVGSRLPAHATAMGRVLLAGLPPEALAALYRDTPLPRLGRGAPATLAALQARARRDAKRGHVVHLGDFEDGMASIAAPLRDAAGAPVAAIAITAPVAEAALPERQLRHVLAAAASFS